ncbi:MAG: hypothetical protein M5U09_26725 [Gammaproteobacteria bacterium]|nr:hypothetical protein [Gammaproteobacteria bacterium]
MPFVDVFPSLPRLDQPAARAKGVGQAPALALDAKGWGHPAEPGCFAETPLCTITGGHYPRRAVHGVYEGDRQA